MTYPIAHSYPNRNSSRKRCIVVFVCLVAALLLSALGFPTKATTSAHEAGIIEHEYFAATKHFVYAPFLQTFNNLGGVRRFGSPLSEAWEQSGVSRQLFQNALLQLDSGGVVKISPLGALAVAGRPADPPLSRAIGRSNNSYMTQTGHAVRLPFLDHWLINNGATRLGLPISEVLDAGSTAVQCYEFACLSVDASYPGAIREQLRDNIRSANSPFTPVSAAVAPDVLFVPTTGHNIRGGFLEQYRLVNGQDALGMPLTDEVLENKLTVQYFELGKLEFHPDNPQGQQVLFSLLGVEWLKANGVPPAALQPRFEAAAEAIPTATPVVPQPTTVAQLEGVPSGWNEISRGSSTFKGSSENRSHNIFLAAARLDGVVVGAGEDFSFNLALGDDSADAGFVKAPVIYGGQTIEGVGGGICQLSSTIFRAAFFAGFDIIERRNHSYRIPWYEPLVGFDATVYSDEDIDLRWRNNLNAPVLLKTKIDSDLSTLDVVLYSPAPLKYKVQFDGPYISNEVEHGTPLYQDDPNLPVGTLKQVEFAANGLDVTINRLLLDPTTGNLLRKESFSSHYVPWRAVYKRGTGSTDAPDQSTGVTVQQP